MRLRLGLLGFSISRIEAYRSVSHLAEYLLTAENRPGMYFGSHLLSDVRLVLEGWRQHRRFVPDTDPIADVMDGFTKFVEKRYNDDRTMGPFLMISEYTDDPQQEFSEFMRIFREYLDTHPDLTDTP